MQPKLHSQIILIAVLLLAGCSPKIILAELSNETVRYEETIHINNCGNKANSTQAASRSFSTKIEGNITVDYQKKIEGNISATYEQYRNITKTQTLTAAPETNMEFTLRWSDNVRAGNATINGKTANYTVNIPISVEQVSSKDLGCNTNTSLIPATSTPISSPEIKDWTLGDLIFSEDFEDEKVNEIRTMWGSFDIIKTDDGNHVWQTARNSDGYIILPTTSNDYAFEAKVMQVSGQSGFAEMQIRSFESAKPCPTNYAIWLDPSADWLTLIESGADGTTCKGLKETGLYADYQTPLSNGVWYTLRIEGKGAEVRVYLNGNLVARDTDIDGTISQSNTILFGTCCYDSQKFVFNYDDIKVWLLNP